jgi:hypothetical protein
MMTKSKWFLCFVSLAACSYEPSSDQVQQVQQEQVLMEATQQTGMPAIANFRERKLVKDLLELRDQEGLVTYTYFWSAFLGKFVFVGQTIGYGIPAATQYTNPQKISRYSGSGGAFYEVLPQADPNGLFSPSSSEATWIMMLNPGTNKVEPQYLEERISVFTFPLPPRLVVGADQPAPKKAASDPTMLDPTVAPKPGDHP